MIRQFLYSLCVMLLCATHVAARIYTPEQVPNPKTTCATCWVSNPDGILTVETERELNQRLDLLFQTNGVEMAVVVLDSIENDDEYDFAYRLFNTWQIGNADNNSGVLILFVNGIRAVKIEVGLGMEGLLPDAACNQVLYDVMFPYFKQGDYAAGLLAGVDDLSAQLTTDEAMEELLLRQNAPDLFWWDVLFGYLTIAFLMFILLLWRTYRATNRLSGANNVRYGQLRSIIAVLGLHSIFFPVPILFLRWWVKKYRKRVRSTPLVCSHCGETMRLLSEKEEDEYLNSSQLVEEKVQSIDYDVWLCEHCHATEVMPYAPTYSRYKKCPKCGAHTYKLEKNRVIVSATTSKTGSGEREYECQHCHYKKVESYIIPIVTVSSGGGSGHGGGGGGGSFGGGCSGGGGAGGRF